MARAVPQEVEDFLNIGTVKSGAETVSLNFMSQFQPPLLHAFSHRRIADLISSSAALDDYNIAVKAVAARREQLKGSFNTVDSAMANLKQQIDEKSKKIIQQRDLAERLRKLQKDYLRLAERLERSETAFKTAVFVRDKHSTLRSKVSSLKSLDLLATLKERKDSIQLLRYQLAEMQRGTQLRDRKIRQLQVFDRLLETSTRREEAHSLSDSIKSVGTWVQERYQIERRLGKLQSDLEKVTLIQSKLQALSKCQEIRSRLEQLKIMISQIKWTEARIEEKQQRLYDNVCPLCGAALNHE